MEDLFSGIINEKVLRIILLFLENPDELYHINKVASETSIPVATVFRIMKRLVSLNIVRIHHVSKWKVYSLLKNKKTSTLAEILK